MTISESWLTIQLIILATLIFLNYRRQRSH